MKTVVNPNFRKKKQPQLVRANLLEATAQVVIERGLPGVTLDLVARRAGVSKGGLLHHFSSKQALLEGLHLHMLDDFEAALGSFIETDPEPRGRFFRAYVRATIDPQKPSVCTELFGAFALGMSHDDHLARMWREWFQAQAAKHGADLRCPVGSMIRYAADGIWMEYCIGVFLTSDADRQAVADYLIKLTYEMPDPSQP